MRVKTLTLMGGLLLVFPFLNELNSNPEQNAAELNSGVNSETPREDLINLENLKKVHDFEEVFDDPSQGSIPYEPPSVVMYKTLL